MAAPHAAPHLELVTAPAGPSLGRRHLRALRAALAMLEPEIDRIDRWGRRLHSVLAGGNRVLLAGNGGSAAQAQHVAGELARRWGACGGPAAIVALPSETSVVTAVACERGWDDVFAAQVRAYGRAGDVLVSLSTSGRSRNVLAAAEAARLRGVATWALTGPRPNPLADAVDEALCIDAAATATVQEVHQVALDLVCATVGAP